MSEASPKPLISVVVPFAGNVEWLGEAVESVLRQTLKSWELVIVSDEPLALTRDLSRLDSRIRVLKGAGTGPAANRNIGVRASHGEYVAFLDADDAFRPTKLERQLTAMQEHRAAFAHTSYERVDVDGQSIAEVASGQYGGNVYPSILLRCPVATPTVMARRQLLLASPFNETLRVGEDTLEWIALARVANLLGIDEPLSCVRIHGANAALNLESQIAAWRSIYELALPADITLPHGARRSIKAEIYKTIALLEWQRGRRVSAARATFRAFILRPWPFRLKPFRPKITTSRVKHYVFSLHPEARAQNRLRGPERNVEWISRADASSEDKIRTYLEPARTIVDVGSGIKPQTLLSPDIHICVEPFEPYVQRLREELADDQRFLFFNAAWDQVLPFMPDRSVDSVLVLDVIEHLKYRAGRRLVSHAVRISRKQVVIFTPLGFYRQSYSKGATDRWGMRGTYWQTHRSGWLPEDFPADWQIVACADFHLVDEHDEPLAQPFGAFWAIFTHREGRDAVTPDRRRLIPESLDT